MVLTTGIQTLDDLDLENQTVFLRTDLDAPLTRSGEIIDDARIQDVVPTIQKLKELGARIVVASRFGELSRGSEKKRGEAPPSIEAAAARLGELCGCEVLLPDGCTGESVKKVLLELRGTQIAVLENLATDDDQGPGAEAFARQLLEYVDVYVADSVRALEGESATTTILPRLMEFRAASPRVMRELSTVSRIQSGIDPPRFIIWGGNTLSGRLDLLHTLAGDSARVMLVGVAGNTMLRALGTPVGKSAVEEGYLAGARTLAERLGNRLLLPQDVMVAPSPKATTGSVRSAKQIHPDEMALDIGPETIATITAEAARAGTAIFCGTAGFHKAEPFAHGTRGITLALARSSAFTLVAGDDSVAAARATCADQLDSIDCVARGGPATLALLNETKLPGLSALRGTTTHE
jgi:phosphoglycerate kinase